MTASKKLKKIIITERDMKLFKYLYVNKVASFEDINLDIFGQVSSSAVCRRLKKLLREGLLEAQICRELSIHILYNLSQKAFKKYFSDINSLNYIQLKSDSILHDLSLLKIKRKLKKISQVEAFYSENLIRSGLLDDILEVKRLKDLHSDSILKVNFFEKSLYLPLEYEASSKSPKRNQNLVNKYYTNPYTSIVLFVSKTKQIESKIRSKEQQEDNTKAGQFFYIQSQDLLYSKKDIEFFNIKNNSFILN